MAADQEYTIRNFDELKQVRNSVRLYGRRMIRIYVHIGALTTEENLALKKKLQIAYNSQRFGHCRKGGTLAFYTFLIMLWLGIFPVNQSDILLTLVILIIMCVAGMCMSRLWCYFQVLHELTRAENHYRKLAETSDSIIVNNSLTMS